MKFVILATLVAYVLGEQSLLEAVQNALVEGDGGHFCFLDGSECPPTWKVYHKRGCNDLICVRTNKDPNASKGSCLKGSCSNIQFNPMTGDRSGQFQCTTQSAVLNVKSIRSCWDVATDEMIGNWTYCKRDEISTSDPCPEGWKSVRGDCGEYICVNQAKKLQGRCNVNIKKPTRGQCTSFNRSARGWITGGFKCDPKERGDAPPASNIIDCKRIVNYQKRNAN